VKASCPESLAKSVPARVGERGVEELLGGEAVLIRRYVVALAQASLGEPGSPMRRSA